MRALLEEYGNVIIAVFAATVMITVIIFGGIFPIMNEYTAAAVPEDTVKNATSKEALEESLERTDPVITADDTITLTQGNSINFKDYISEKTITAVNADGTDISASIIFKAGNSESAKYFNSKTGVFGGADLPKGEYKLLLSVADIVGEGEEREHFGKISQKIITIIVQ